MLGVPMQEASVMFVLSRQLTMENLTQCCVCHYTVVELGDC